MTALRISSTLSLPTDYVTKTCAILAQRRVGKTYTAAVLAEELVTAKQPFVALDPTGAWWGLRADADGKRAGLPVVIFGGQHGDLPLERGSGRFIADLVVEEPNFYVIDLSLLESKEAERAFATEFGERLYRRKASTKSHETLHLFVDESDLFVPQRPLPGDQRMLGAYEAIVRRGGLFGLGTTLISQRSAVVNKNVLEQLDILIALRTVGPNDRKRIDEIVSAKAEPSQRAELLDSIASLQRGEAWVWEPAAVPPLFARIQVRQRRTFNSSETPRAGEHRIEPQHLAAVDLEQLRGRMAATIERAKADDPRELRKRILELERQVGEKKVTPAPVEVIVEKPVLNDEQLKELRQVVVDAGAKAEYIENAAAQLRAAADLIVRSMGLPNGTPKLSPLPSRANAEPARSPAKLREILREIPRETSRQSDGRPGPQQRILDALVRLDSVCISEPSKIQLALFAGASPRSSAYTNNLGALRSAGLIDYPTGGFVKITAHGRRQANPVEIPVSTAELQQAVAQLIGGAKWRILKVLIDIFPRSIDKTTLAERAGASPTSSAYTNNLGALRTLGFLDYPQQGYVAAEAVLFVEEAMISSRAAAR